MQNFFPFEKISILSNFSHIGWRLKLLDMVLCVDNSPCEINSADQKVFLHVCIRLKIKPNSVRIRFQSCQIFVLPSTGFEPTPLLHCSTIRLALRPAPQTTRLHPLPIYIYVCNVFTKACYKKLSKLFLNQKTQKNKQVKA